MALPRVSPAKTPAENYAAINQAVAAAEQLPPQIAALASRLREYLDLLSSAAPLGPQVASIQADLVDRLGIADDSDPASRPGDAPRRFTTSLAGGMPTALPQVPVSWVTTDDDGAIVRLRSAGLIASRRYWTLEPGRTYRVRWAFRRRTDAVDPANDALRLGVAWYDQNRVRLAGGAAGTVFHTLTELAVADGREFRTALISRTAGAGVTAAPANARRFRIYAEAFGGAQATDVEILEVTDVTDAVLYSPDLTALQSSVDGLISQALSARLATVESAVGTPLSPTYATRAAAAAATIPAPVNRIVVFGFADINDGGEGVYARAPGLPAHSFYFQSADGAYWIPAGPEVYLEQAGAVGDGVVDDSDALDAVVEFLNDRGGGVGRTRGWRTFRITRGSPLIQSGVSLLLRDSTIKPDTADNINCFGIYGQPLTPTTLAGPIAAGQQGFSPSSMAGMVVGNSVMVSFTTYTDRGNFPRTHTSRIRATNGLVQIVAENLGAGYTAAPTATPSYGDAKLQCRLNGNGSLVVSIQDPGSEYDPLDPPDVILTGGGPYSEAAVFTAAVAPVILETPFPKKFNVATGDTHSVLPYVPVKDVTIEATIDGRLATGDVVTGISAQYHDECSFRLKGNDLASGNPGAFSGYLGSGLYSYCGFHNSFTADLRRCGSIVWADLMIYSNTRASIAAKSKNAHGFGPTFAQCTRIDIEVLLSDTAVGRGSKFEGVMQSNIRGVGVSGAGFTAIGIAGMCSDLNFTAAQGDGSLGSSPGNMVGAWGADQYSPDITFTGFSAGNNTDLDVQVSETDTNWIFVGGSIGDEAKIADNAGNARFVGVNGRVGMTFGNNTIAARIASRPYAAGNFANGPSFRFESLNSNGQMVPYLDLGCQTSDVTAGFEEGTFVARVPVDGAMTDAFYATRSYIGGGADNVASAGASSLRFTTGYFASNIIVGSDQRLKTDPRPIGEAEIRAWARVEWAVFQYLSAVAEKGSNARQHAGTIAQRVEAAFEEEGLDPRAYALFCEDPEMVRVTRAVPVQRPKMVEFEVTDTVRSIGEDGTEVWTAEPRRQRRMIFDAKGPVMETVTEDREFDEPTGRMILSLRYEQCLVFEAAYQRARANRSEEALTDLLKRVKALEVAAA